MISVLMTTYNCGEYIAQSIKSILNQTYKDFEFLIIDDGSTDNTEEVVCRFNDNRIVYKKIAHIGRSKALNHGLSICQHKLVSIMDADDVAHSSKIEKQIKLLSGEENEICFTDAAYFSKNKIRYISQNKFKNNEINEMLALHGHFTNSTFMFYKNHILNCGGYDESLDVFEDYDLLLKIKDKSKFIFVNEVLQFQRLRNQSLSRGNNEQLNKKIYNLQKPYYLDLSKSFKIFDPQKQKYLCGWREFFYGSKDDMRKYWCKINYKDWNYKMLLAYLISYFPQRFVDDFKKQSFRLRISYFFNKSKKYNGLDKEFKNILKEVSV